MQIFYGEKDIDYNNPNGYAFLNWRFDDSMGGNNKENPFQGISDNFEMGKALWPARSGLRILWASRMRLYPDKKSGVF